MTAQNLHGQQCVPSCWDSTIRSLTKSSVLVHTEDCSHLSSLIILYIGKDLIGWSWKNVSGPASHLLLFILCHKKTKLTLHISTQVNHLSYFSHNTQSSLTWPMLPPGFSSSSIIVKLKKCQIPKQLSFLTIQEIHNAETYWMSVIQCQHFSQEINTLLKHRIPHVPIFFCTNFWTLRSIACRQQDFQLYWWVL